MTALNMPLNVQPDVCVLATEQVFNESSEVKVKIPCQPKSMVGRVYEGRVSE